MKRKPKKKEYRSIEEFHKKFYPASEKKKLMEEQDAHKLGAKLAKLSLEECIR